MWLIYIIYTFTACGLVVSNWSSIRGPKICDTMCLFCELVPTEHDIVIDTHLLPEQVRYQKESDAETATAKQGEEAVQVRIKTEL